MLHGKQYWDSECVVCSNERLLRTKSSSSEMDTAIRKVSAIFAELISNAQSVQCGCSLSLDLKKPITNFSFHLDQIQSSVESFKCSHLYVISSMTRWSLF